MDRRDYSKTYRGEDQEVKTTQLTLVKSDGEEVTLTGDILQIILDLLESE